MADRIRGHIGNGTVYLHGWINVDLFESGSALAKDCPAGVAKWGTDETDYYRNLRHMDELYLGKGTPDHETTVTDRYGSWSNLPFEDEEVDELWSVQCFEHLSKKEARYALMEARRVLKTGGLLTLDVPEHEQTIEEYAHLYHESAIELDVERKFALKKRAAFMMRHLLGSRHEDEDFGFHMGSWKRDRLVKFCRRYGFAAIRDNENFHFYPAFSVTFQKLPQCGIPELDDPIHPWKAAWQYVDLPKREPHQTFIEVGPGTAPWPEAGLYCDIVDRPSLPPMSFCIGDVQKLPYTDKVADFIYAAHCLEHVEDPVKAASELSRVAKAGCVVCPSPLKEGLFAFHEQDHKWNVFKSGDTLYFKRIPEGLYPALYNADVTAEMHRLWRYGDRRLEGLANKLKRWMHENEPRLDVIHHWKYQLKVVVLE